MNKKMVVYRFIDNSYSFRNESCEGIFFCQRKKSNFTIYFCKKRKEKKAFIFLPPMLFLSVTFSAVMRRNTLIVYKYAQETFTFFLNRITIKSN